MTDLVNRRWLLASRPEGEPKAADFRMEEAPVPEPGAGELLIRTIYLSLDPYMRGRMSDAKSYAAPVPIGGVLEGETVGEVVVSNHPDYAVGDVVLNRIGWQSFGLSDGTGLRKLDPGAAPISTALGVLGMPGLTAYAGLKNIGQPKEGETVVVAAASGAVGSVVGQIAKIRGARAVGIAGGPEKCAFVKDELGFDAVIDHRAPDFAAQLAAACPDGIDVYFENVSGKVFDAVFPLFNPFARMPVCGTIAFYNATSFPEMETKVPALMRAILTKRIRIQGFIVYDFAADYPDFARDMAGWIADGHVTYREDIVDGLDRAPVAFMGLLKGGNFGKLVVKVGQDPTRS
ncbi:NADP-dependent oxidoreductase [Nisaea acidiphila]|uniref:NADP-dependent oxidoreductase n=1 Tax=Nisaea acidiphila TaxID=1862145 RepID=A0A9J7AU52_9PROT|nr:NADP-dependent oxidoreductase [Nisaea acidiphila]UUX50630.1 NADP-dependent oxidoreductase [Nisaea acidiphila]